MVRDATRLVLERGQDIRVVGEAATAAAAAASIRALEPEVVLLDVSVASGAVADLIRRLRETVPSARLLVLGKLSADGVFSAIAAGAAGWTSKEESGDRLACAVRALASGCEYLGDALPLAALPQMAERLRARGARTLLTSGDLDVLGLLATGNPYKEIAARLEIMEATVKARCRDMYRKMGARNGAHACRIAVQQGLIDPPLTPPRRPLAE